MVSAADTPPPAYMPPDEQMGQDGTQSMETGSSMPPQNMPRGGKVSLPCVCLSVYPLSLH